MDHKIMHFLRFYPCLRTVCAFLRKKKATQPGGFFVPLAGALVASKLAHRRLGSESSP
jgi:hypothetical protein